MDAVSRELADKVSGEIRAAALTVLAKHGLKATKMNTKYGDSFGLNITAVATKLDENGVNLTSAEAILYERYGHYGLVNGATVKLTAKLGAKFDSRGRKFMFAGVRSRGKSRILAKCEQDGKDYVFADTIIPTLNKAK